MSKISPKLTVYCVYHDPQQIIDYQLKETENFKLFNVNSAPTGRNINYLNLYYNEFVAQYWAYYNDNDSDYIGFCHYRRRFDMDKVDLSKLNDETCYGLELVPCANHWVYRKNFMLVNDYYEYIIPKYGSDSKYLNLGCEGNLGANRECFIMSRKKFNEMFDFVFGFVNFINNKYNLDFDVYKTDSFLDKQKKWFFKFNENDAEYEVFIIGNCIYRSIGLLIEMLIGLFTRVNFKTENLYLSIVDSDRENIMFN